MTKLKNISTLPPEHFTKEKCKSKLDLLQLKLFDLQNKFYADSRYSLLIIFQGLDTSGKDGTIRHVMSCMSPMGVQVKSFKKPTELELSHDFLWRVYPHFPEKGMIKVFNRSYYEDILIPTLEKKMGKESMKDRAHLISEIEKNLERNNTKILKIFLHISQKEQKERIHERLTLGHKNWKYAKEDELVAERWEEYVEVYDQLLDKCKQPKWHIIPADKRWYRNYAVAQLIENHLESLPLKYPEAVVE